MPKNPEAKSETGISLNPEIASTQNSVRGKIMDLSVRGLDIAGNAVSVGAELLGIGAGALIKTTGKATIAAAKGVFQGMRGAAAKNVSQAI